MSGSRKFTGSSSPARKKSREEVLLERLHRSGVRLDLEQRDAPFKFVVSPTTTAGVDSDETGRLAADFKVEVFRIIKGLQISSSLTGVVIFPRILDKNISKLADGITYKRKERSYFVKRNIPFAVWQTATHDLRLDIFADNLCESIRSIPARHLSDGDKSKILAAIDEARSILKQRSLH
jgi:hypothetical protein